MKYIKTFENHAEYEAFTASTAFVTPNVSFCDNENESHYTELACEESTVYELVGEPSYPSNVDGYETSFEISFSYKKTDTDTNCQETITEGSDIITVECGSNPSTSESRVVSGTIEWNGIDIEYSVTQSKFIETRVVTTYNVTDTSNPTKIGQFAYISGFSAIEIDGVVLPEVVSAYTFSTTGNHTVKYTLKDPTSIGNYYFFGCSGMTSVNMPDTVTSVGNGSFQNCYGLTSINVSSCLTSIGSSSFFGCSGLTSVIIPSGVTSIGDNAFNGCKNLSSIASNAKIAPSIQSYTFYNVKTNGTLTVPSGNSGYDTWMQNANYYLGKYGWTKVTQ